MFDNLVESGSHKQDLGRKGSFILGTVVIYAVLFTAVFIGGIIWYDAALGEQDLELTTLVAPVPVPQVEKAPEKQEEAKPTKAEQNVDVRKELIADVSRTELVPKEVSAKASDIPPVRRGVTTVVGTESSNAAAPISGPGTGTGIVAGPTQVNIADEPPPPPPKPTPPRAPVSGGVLNGKAISLPKPAYPAIARTAHASGTVVVQVLIDENGNVVSAHAVSGHPLLTAVAVAAARGARFSPTKLSGQPVKVTGVITYNFVAQ
ncbi:MAG: periplasmic protein TonB [Pyrinomonadaceae bacterium]|jgi:protein TonB|nr:periplasmic protein TonB [Pyrinomonadaceae bacterium]